MDWKDDRAVARLKEMLDEGRTHSEMAAEFGCSRNAVAGKINRLGLSDPSVEKWPAERIAQLRTMLAAGLGARRIGHEFGMAPSSIQNKMNRLGLRSDGSRRPRLPPRPKTNRLWAQAASVVAAPSPLSADQKEFILGAGIKLLDLEPHHCRWPLNETEKGGQYFFCGEKKRQDGPYCPYHTDVAELGRILADMKHARLTGKKQEAA